MRFGGFNSVTPREGSSPLWVMPMPLSICGMAIGDHVLYQGRRYVLSGIDPMGVTDRCAELCDPVTGDTLRVPIDEVEEANNSHEFRNV
jgi:hypothetical protein